VSDTIESVSVFDRRTGCLAELSSVDCGFAYRSSRFKREDAGQFGVTAVRFRLRENRPTLVYEDVVAQLARQGTRSPTVQDVREAVLSIRRRKGMVSDPSDTDTRSVGSFFINPVVSAATYAGIVSSVAKRVPHFPMPDGQVKIPAAWMIEQAGLGRGHVAGGAAISTKHTLAIVNRGAATAREVVGLAADVKRRVLERFGVWLQPEPVFVGFAPDDPTIEYLRSTGTPVSK
jgi:UDP-N-acetylmuramate dehydrogenase